MIGDPTFWERVMMFAIIYDALVNTILMVAFLTVCYVANTRRNGD